LEAVASGASQELAIYRAGSPSDKYRGIRLVTNHLVGAGESHDWRP
jgi:hypothetical protein